MGIGRGLNRELFLYALDLEVKRARRSQYSFCALHLKLSKRPGKENGKGLQSCHESLSNWLSGEFARLISSALWRTMNWPSSSLIPIRRVVCGSDLALRAG